MGNYENILALMQEYSGQDYRRAKLEDLQSMDRTPQFVQDAENCWLYSMFNNAYFNLHYKLSSDEVMEIKEEMRSYGINIEDGAGSPLSGAFIARYLSQKTGKKIRAFNIDILGDKNDFVRIAAKLGYVFEIARVASPAFYADIDDNGEINQIHPTRSATGLHSTNVRYDRSRCQFKELGSWGNSRYNSFYYELKQFVENIRIRGISQIFTFFAEMKDA